MASTPSLKVKQWSWNGDLALFDPGFSADLAKARMCIDTWENGQSFNKKTSVDDE